MAQLHLSLLLLALVVADPKETTEYHTGIYKSGPGVLQALKPQLRSSCLKDQHCPSLLRPLMSKSGVRVQEGGQGW